VVLLCLDADGAFFNEGAACDDEDGAACDADGRGSGVFFGKTKGPF
jgi:hypothetical protein